MPRPWVLAHNIASLDGRVTIVPGVLLLHGDERWSAVVGDGDPYAKLRDELSPDAILEGSCSFIVDDEGLAEPASVRAAEDPELAADFLP